MFASVEGEPYVKLLSVRVEGASGAEEIHLSQLRKVQAHCSRILWLARPQLLLCAKWKQETDSHAVRAWRVSRAGRRTDRCGKPLSKEEGVDINTWCALQLPPAAADTASGASAAAAEGAAGGRSKGRGGVGGGSSPAAPSSLVVLFDVNREQLIQYQLV